VTLELATPFTSTTTVFVALNFGGVVSLTVIVKEPDAPIDVQLTEVVPNGNVDPGAGMQVAARLPLTGSVAVGGI